MQAQGCAKGASSRQSSKATGVRLGTCCIAHLLLTHTLLQETLVIEHIGRQQRVYHLGGVSEQQETSAQRSPEAGSLSPRAGILEQATDSFKGACWCQVWHHCSLQLQSYTC